MKKTKKYIKSVNAPWVFTGMNPNLQDTKKYSFIERRAAPSFSGYERQVKKMELKVNNKKIVYKL